MNSACKIRYVHIHALKRTPPSTTDHGHLSTSVPKQNNGNDYYSDTMSDNTVLVTGATGLLGRQILRAFERSNWTAKGTGLSRADGETILKLDLNKDAEIKQVLEKVK